MILQQVGALLTDIGADVKLGFLPDKPDTVIALFEYQGEPPQHSFGHTDDIHNIQARTRALSTVQAYELAELVAERLHRYSDGNIAILRSSAILDIGHDGANPQRKEYTVNFTVRRL